MMVMHKLKPLKVKEGSCGMKIVRGCYLQNSRIELSEINYLQTHPRSSCWSSNASVCQASDTYRTLTTTWGLCMKQLLPQL